MLDVITILSKIFADDTKAHSEVNSNKDQENIQSSINNMDDWTVLWLLGFNCDKCSVMHLGKNNPNFSYTIGKDLEKRELKVSTCEKDLGVFVDPLLNFESHIISTVKKARKIVGLIQRNIINKTPEIMVLLFKSLIRPILEYANVVWSPYKRKYVDLIEQVQRNYSKCIIGLKDLTYKDRLVALNLPSLEFRRVRGDLIEVYKILNNIYDPITTKNLLTLCSKDLPTRSHPYKLLKYRTNTEQFKHFFSNRVVNIWNNLPTNVVMAKSVNSFKGHIDRHLSEHMFDTNLDKLYY